MNPPKITEKMPKAAALVNGDSEPRYTPLWVQFGNARYALWKTLYNDKEAV